MSRGKQRREFTVGDLLAVAAGAGLGLVLGFFAAERVGRVNARRVTSALERWKSRRRSSGEPWTEEEAERLEARVLDAAKPAGPSTPVARRSTQAKPRTIGGMMFQ